jgi:hypothetical protein
VYAKHRTTANNTKGDGDYHGSTRLKRTKLKANKQ